MFDSQHGCYIYAEHPDVCLYLYHFVKMIMLGGKDWLLSKGVTEMTISGGELMPNEEYLPENMFSRVVNVKTMAPFVVPRPALVDARKAKVVGIYADDVVVDGVRGGVHPYPQGLPEDYNGEEIIYDEREGDHPAEDQTAGQQHFARQPLRRRRLGADGDAWRVLLSRRRQPQGRHSSAHGERVDGGVLDVA